MSKVRLGLIGSGGMARHHINILQGISDAELVAITEPNPDQRRATTERFPNLQGVPFFDDYREMLDKVEMDGVISSRRTPCTTSRRWTRWTKDCM